MKVHKASLVLLIVAVCSFSCSNDDNDDGPQEPTVMELITSESWYLEGFGDFILDDCDKHSTYRFGTDGSILIEAHSLDAEDNCMYDGDIMYSWELISDTEFILTEDGDDLTCLITVLSENDFSFDLGEDSFNYVLDKNPGNG